MEWRSVRSKKRITAVVSSVRPNMDTVMSSMYVVGDKTHSANSKRCSAVVKREPSGMDNESEPIAS